MSIIADNIKVTYKLADEGYYFIRNKIDTYFNDTYNARINGFLNRIKDNDKALNDFRFLIDFLVLVRLKLDNTSNTTNYTNYIPSGYREYFMCEYNFDISPLIKDVFHLDKMQQFGSSITDETEDISNTIIEFIYGFNDILLDQDNIYTALSKGISYGNIINSTFNGNLGYIYFGLPLKYGVLSSILDPNGLEFIRAFNRELWVVNGEDYYIYWLGETKCNNDTYKFIR